MITISSLSESPAQASGLKRLWQIFQVPGGAEDPRRRRRLAGYRVALDDKSIALYGYDKSRLNRISAALNLY